jgi:hypothetical protein
MPYVRCPVCADTYHLLVRENISDWENDHVTERDEYGTPLLRCIRCWVSLRVGHIVTLRIPPKNAVSALEAGLKGIVEATAQGEEELFLMVFGDIRVWCRRDELFYVPGQ